MANSVTTFQLVRFKMLLAVGANAGTLTIEFQPEVNSSAVTCKAGSFGTIRDVTSTVSQKAMDQSSTDNTNYADVFTQAIGANESYWFEWVGAYTASAVGVGLNQRMNGIPSGSSMAAVLRDCENSASTDGAAILARDGTAIDNTTSEGATEALFTGHGAIVNGATPGTLAWQFKINNGDTGTVTIVAGWWFFAEECDLPALRPCPQSRRSPRSPRLWRAAAPIRRPNHERTEHNRRVERDSRRLRDGSRQPARLLDDHAGSC
jgi:hypothetical protein